MTPKWTPNGPNIVQKDPKRIPKGPEKNTKRNPGAPQLEGDGHQRSHRGARWSQEGPRGAPGESKMGLDGRDPKRSLGDPRKHQGVPTTSKMDQDGVQRVPKGRPKGAKGAQGGPNDPLKYQGVGRFTMVRLWLVLWAVHGLCTFYVWRLYMACA